MNVNTGVFVVNAGMTGLLDNFDVLLLNIADECSLNLRKKLEVMESAEERKMLAMTGSCVSYQRWAQKSIKKTLTSDIEPEVRNPSVITLYVVDSNDEGKLQVLNAVMVMSKGEIVK